MKRIDEDIKNNRFSSLYLLYGEEKYLMVQYKNKLVSALTQPGDTMNYSSVEGKNVNAKEMIDLAETLPFFADRRLILLENTGWFKKTNEEMAEYIKHMPKTTCMVFVEEEIDKKTKMYKAAKSAGMVVEFVPQTEDTIIRWIGSRLKKENKQMTREALQLFLTMTGTNMGNIDRELEKLLCYCMDKNEIYPQDVEAICSGQIHNQIFDMISAIALRNPKKALELYYDLLELKEAPLRILFLIARQFDILFKVKSMRMKGLDDKSIAATAGIPPFAVARNVKQASGFSLKQLKDAIEDAVAAEEDVKTGRMTDQMAVELLIVKYSNQKPPEK